MTGGTYYRTYTNAGTGPTAEADLATVDDLRLDKYLVTVGRFRRFVAAWQGGAGYTPPAGSGTHSYLNGGLGLANSASPGTYETGWVAGDEGFLGPTDADLACGSSATWTSTPGANETLPIDCVNWFEAYAFCIWDGAFLPSEAEWEYAAAGGSEQREYPWGSALPGKDNRRAVYGYDNGMDCYFPSAGACTGVANIAPVGTATQGAGFAAQLDLAGEVGEWALDWFAPYVDPCVDCVYLSDSVQYRVIRGGAYDLSPSFFLPPYRGGRYPSGRNDDVGFRCARAP